MMNVEVRDQANAVDYRRVKMHSIVRDWLALRIRNHRQQGQGLIPLLAFRPGTK
jgi:hypothetical protein